MHTSAAQAANPGGRKEKGYWSRDRPARQSRGANPKAFQRPSKSLGSGAVGIGNHTQARDCLRGLNSLLLLLCVRGRGSFCLNPPRELVLAAEQSEARTQHHTKGQGRGSWGPMKKSRPCLGQSGTGTTNQDGATRDRAGLQVPAAALYRGRFAASGFEPCRSEGPGQTPARSRSEAAA